MEFTIRTDPIPKERTKSSGKIHYTPKRTKDFEEFVFASVKADMFAMGLVESHNLMQPRSAFAKTVRKSPPFIHSHPFGKGVRIGIVLSFYRETAQVADFDNMSKSATDALNGLLWWDDNQIEGAHVRVYRKVGEEQARIELEVMLIEEFEERFGIADLSDPASDYLLTEYIERYGIDVSPESLIASGQGSQYIKPSGD